MYNVLMDMNDEISYDDTVQVSCWTCYRKYSVSVGDFEDTYSARGNRFYCAADCARGDLE